MATDEPKPAKAEQDKPKPTKKPAKGKKAAKPKYEGGLLYRRLFCIWSTFAFLAAGAFATVRFFFPRMLFEPKTRFRIGYPADYALGVDTKWQQAQRIWVVRDSKGVYVIFAKCTHLGCTPDWNAGESKFKCPCHGSGFNMEGVNFEGPAPRPLDRVYVELDAEGQIVVDKAILLGPDRWEEDGAFIG